VSQGSPGLSAPPTVSEGGSVTVDVSTGAKEIWVAIPGRRPFSVPVRGGRAEFQVPPGVPGGTRIPISDLLLPKPSGTSILVVGNS
jgi:hypothetical protein